MQQGTPSSAPYPPIPEENAQASFLRRRLILPLMDQLRQGATPEKLAQSVAWGGVLGVFPILGTTTGLCGIAAIFMRLNHIAIQSMNWLVYPLQLLLIIPLLRFGNFLFGVKQFPLSLSEITARFEADFLGSMRDLGGLAIRGVVAWAVVAIPVAWLAARILTPVFAKLALRMRKTGDVS